jgi:rubrerythrin
MKILSFLITILLIIGLFQFNQAEYTNIALQNDLDVLNYALSLEHLEATFYSQMQAQFSAQDFIDAGFTASVYNYFSVIGAHEAAHVTAITNYINVLNGTAAPVCTYDFSAVTNVSTYIATSIVLESVGASAYAGGLNGLTLAGLQQVAATIATVEARHASFLLYISDMTPFPDAFQPTLMPNETAAIAASLIVSCPNGFTLPMPTIRPYGVSAVANRTTSINPPFVNYTQAQIENDVATLQFALTLEHLEATFYTTLQQQFNMSDFVDYGLNETDYLYFELIRDHEVAHVQFLNDSLTAAGITPVAACEYNFTAVVDVATYLTLAKTFENVGVGAYNGAANAITDFVYQQAAATIVEIEARHAAYLNLIAPNSTSPFPTAVDIVLTPAEVVELVSPFITNCVQFENLVAPTVAPQTTNMNDIIAPDGSIIPSGIVGDPQFVGLRGQSYQVHGIDGEVYNLITSDNLQVNSRFVYLDSGKCQKEVAGHKIIACWSHPGSYLGEVAIKLRIDGKLHTVLLVSGDMDHGFESILFDGQPMAVSDSMKVEDKEGERVEVEYTHSHYITVNTRLFSFGFESSDLFINQRVRVNVDFETLKQKNTHGLFGQSYKAGIRKGPIRKIKEIEGDVDEYAIVDGNLFGDDFMYNTFSA